MGLKYDAIVVGTGQAGPSLVGRMASAGMKVAVVERKLFGGTCVNTGCIPTKTMVASAYCAELARRGAQFGVSTGQVKVDLGQVIARKNRVSADSREPLEKWLKSMDNCTVYEGHARFTGPHTLQVNGDTLEADKIFLNVGGRAVVPDMPGISDIPVLTNTSIMQLDELPEHLIVVGGSYIGLEFAQMFRRFGSQVTILQRASRLIPREDEDVSAAVRSILENEGVKVHTDACCIGFSNQDQRRQERSGGLRRQERSSGLEAHSEGLSVKGSHVLVAVGRRPNTDDLGLEKAGIVVDKNGYIPVDDQLRTSVEGIWALGDCNGRGGFTHTAYNDFEIVAANLLDSDPRRVTDRIPCYGLYVDPPLGRCGMTEADVRNAGIKALVGKRPMTRVGRAHEKGETQGFMKVLVDAESKLLLGAAILGVGGDEVVHLLLDVMYARKPYTLIQRAVHIHPTVSELVPTMLGELKPL